MADTAFELITDPSHLGDDEHDAELVPFAKCDLFAGLIPKDALDFPSRIYFEANVTTLASIDYPINNVGWPLVSEKMLRALLAVGDFPHRAVAVTMIDDTITKAERFDAAGNLRPGVGIDGFSALQVTSYTDAFDWARSKYNRDDRFFAETGLLFKYDRRERFFGHQEAVGACKLIFNVLTRDESLELVLALKTPSGVIGDPFHVLALRVAQLTDPNYQHDPPYPRIPIATVEDAREAIASSVNLFQEIRERMLRLDWGC